MKHTFSLFSDYFALRDNRLTALDPREKLLAALALILGALFSTQPWFPSSLLILSAGLLVSIRIPLRVILLRLLPALGIVAVLALLKVFLSGHTPLWRLEVFGVTLVATREGAQVALLLGSRVLGAVSVVMLLGFTTPMHEVCQALRAFGVSQTWVEIAAMVYRYIFALLEHAGDVCMAQRARLGYSTIRRSLASMGVLAGTVFVRAFDQAFRTHMAMRARCYRGYIPLTPLPRFGGERMLRLFILITGIAASLLLLESVA